MIFFLWQQLKEEVYHIRPRNVEKLEEKTNVLTSIPENIL
jgi:hypothetical protein